MCKVQNLFAGSGDAADAGTVALETAAQAMVTTALQEQLVRLQAALDRLDAGTLGLCGRCGEQVPLIRLQVMPWATHCVPCQSIVDRYR
ncbi:TraR/DksA family transcriptional regulator [Catellatospora sp. NPDC049133]|uniref:TraR/DksA family transcriptional regulator n=1 Tax=Catellatospora sp. NPDC049133 TaxID=3155499 RepID=UPI003411133A